MELFLHDDEKFTEGIIGVSTLKTDHVRKGEGGSTRTEKEMVHKYLVHLIT